VYVLKAFEQEQICRVLWLWVRDTRVIKYIKLLLIKKNIKHLSETTSTIPTILPKILYECWNLLRRKEKRLSQAFYLFWLTHSISFKGKRDKFSWRAFFSIESNNGKILLVTWNTNIVFWWSKLFSD
jgi:hypothetical protein